jgi:hypothetical protein
MRVSPEKKVTPEPLAYPFSTYARTSPLFQAISWASSVLFGSIALEQARRFTDDLVFVCW